MRIDRSLLNWGVFLMALGGIPLAVDQGWLRSDIAGELGQLWPLILVGIGLGLILRWTPFAWFGGALVAATFGIIFGAAVVAVPDDDITNLQSIIPAVAIGACTGEDAGPATTSRDGMADAETFRLGISLSCGDLTVARALDASWSLEAAHASDDAPEVEGPDSQGATASLLLSQGGADELAFLGSQAQSDWRVQVPATARLALDATLNAVRADIDLGSGPVSSVAGTVNASDLRLDLASATTPEQARIELTLNAADVELLLPNADMGIDATLNASSLSVCVPAGAPLRVESSSILSGDDLADSGLVEANSALWTTPGFNAADPHVDISVTSTVSSLSLQRPESCS